jgi:hypothetical protein
MPFPAVDSARSIGTKCCCCCCIVQGCQATCHSWRGRHHVAHAGWYNCCSNILVILTGRVRWVGPSSCMACGTAMCLWCQQKHCLVLSRRSRLSYVAQLSAYTLPATAARPAAAAAAAAATAATTILQAGRRHKRYKKSRGRLLGLKGLVPLHSADTAKLRKLGYKRRWWFVQKA